VGGRLSWSGPVLSVSNIILFSHEHLVHYSRLYAPGVFPKTL
jgi:hypothetical protein